MFNKFFTNNLYQINIRQFKNGINNVPVVYEKDGELIYDDKYDKYYT